MTQLNNYTLPQTLLDAAVLWSTRGDQTAIIYLETDHEPFRVTCGEFVSRIYHYAGILKQIGIEPQDLVIIAHTQSLESIYLFWSAMLIGAIPSMFPTLTEKLDPEIYMNNITTIVNFSGAAAVLTTNEFADRLNGRVKAHVVGSGQIQQSASLPVTPATPDPEAIAFLQHSSGSTGLQKGVALSHRAVLRQLASYSSALALNDYDVVVSWLPLYHDMGLIAGFLMPLIQGIPLILMSPFDWVRHPVMLLRAIDTYQGTLCWLPNFAYNHCTRRIRKRDSENLSLRTMRAFVNCSEPVYHSSHEKFYERFANNGVTMEMLSVSYALAENTFAVTQTKIGMPAHVESIDRATLERDRKANRIDPTDPVAFTIVSCGKPIDRVESRVIDSDNNVLSERHVGEIVLRSPFMLTEYYRREDLNATIWHDDGWYKTGDMGYIADGEIYIVGRKKDLIISGGKNIYPQDLEAIVNTVPGVHPGRAAAFGVYDEREGTELIVVAAEVDAVNDDSRFDIERAIRQAISRQTTVTLSYVHLVNENWIIKTSSGKIARAANRDKWLSEQSRNEYQG